ncbi:class I SAM-dependent methyltransferase [Thermoanaerobacter wiegelii]|uniref:class I SAM-dependent methyltransferase n=1 Tax=Thermoanaerobacter wiegelii TaxID=46354 RepID=UPI0002FB9250|nr:class I SAM-dependent methyltransferase [Thermoanaerobacter wiegelii]
MPYYPKEMNITAIDFSPKMLEKAIARANKLGLNIMLKLMDAQQLDFPENSFDVVITAFVFCSVPDPIKGLNEINRVLRKDGELIMLEHVRSNIEPLGTFMDTINPLVVRIYGANINRNTIDNIKKPIFK